MHFSLVPPRLYMYYFSMSRDVVYSCSLTPGLCLLLFSDLETVCIVFSMAQDFVYSCSLTSGLCVLFSSGPE